MERSNGERLVRLKDLMSRSACARTGFEVDVEGGGDSMVLRK